MCRWGDASPSSPPLDPPLLFAVEATWYMRAYVLVLMSGDRCRSLRPCIALIAAVVGTIVICLLNLTALPQYTAVEYHFLTGESHSACFVERATDIYRFVLPLPVHL